MTTVIATLHSKLFPTGTIAYHPAHKYCYILKSDGDERIIYYQDQQTKQLSFKQKIVSVIELQMSA